MSAHTNNPLSDAVKGAESMAKKVFSLPVFLSLSSSLSYFLSLPLSFFLSLPLNLTLTNSRTPSLDLSTLPSLTLSLSLSYGGTFTHMTPTLAICMAKTRKRRRTRWVGEGG